VNLVALLTALVRIPSRGGIDPPGPVLDLLGGWLSDHDLAPERLTDADGEVVGLACRIEGASPRPHYVLDACVDTAPFGDESAWSRSPTSGEVVDGWLHGRGAADSKAAVAVFAHLGAALRRERALPGTLTLLFDADEHTGNFGGARAFFGRRSDVDGVMIGYPGIDEMVIGGRGVLRVGITVRGTAAHSGSRRPAAANAVVLAAELVTRLAALPLPDPDADLGLPPKLTVTAISGGQGFSTVPATCRVAVDVRLTPSFGAERAIALLRTVAPDLEVLQHWPAYRLAEDAPVRQALGSAATEELGRPVPAVVAGPSNIGNYLAGLGIDATAGFGVRHAGLHAVDERIDLATLEPVRRVYERAVRALLR